ncbi:MAG: DUF364 domain-containing protein [Clostridiaceae bacterium]
MIIDELIDRSLAMVQSRKVKDVRAGLGYTCVMLEDGACGLAYTFRNELGNCCGILNAAGSLIGMDAAEIIPWVKENNRLRAAIGLAAINAVINNSRQDWDTGNVLKAFTLNESDTFGMVGEFKPILSKVRTMTKNIYVFELNAAKGSGLYSEDEIPLYLPKCDVVVITATSIINHTIDEVVSHCKNAKEVCLVGPSTPLCSEVFSQHNITMLAGSVVKKPERILEIVSQGGGTMSMKSAAEQVLVRV